MLRLYGGRTELLEGRTFPDSPSLAVLPGFCDVHVHFREPGFSYKETIRTGTLAAARGGYTACLTMPNLNPVPDSPEHLLIQKDLIERTACVGVCPYGSITVGEAGERLSDLEGLAASGAIAFSDDGRGVASEELMEEAMLRAKGLGRVIAAHCEDTRYPAPESEWRELERDLRLAKRTGCRFHVCHVSLKESVDLIRRAKREGVDVTAETAPHYLLLTRDDVKPEGRFRMNPPIGTAADREALIGGIRDGTIDMIATDHAPHSREEKARGFEGSLSGVVGLETAFPLLYTGLVREGILTLDRLVRMMSTVPRARFGLEEESGYTVWELGSAARVDPAEFLSMGRATPFEGAEILGRCLLTVYNGNAVYDGRQR